MEALSLGNRLKGSGQVTHEVIWDRILHKCFPDLRPLDFGEHRLSSGHNSKNNGGEAV